MARKSLLTESMIPRLAVMLATRHKEEAAAQFGINPRTLRRWLRRGREQPDSVHGRLVAAAEVAESAIDGPLSQAELLTLLERQARRGHVRAIELLLAKPWRRQEQPAAPTGSNIDELARRRARRA
jgi:transposase-like protein